jgi:hypothetical protein
VRAAQPAFLLFMLLCLLLLPISALLFLQVPDVVGSSSMCVARLCCLSLSLAGVLGVLLTKALRIVLLRDRSSLRPTNFREGHQFLTVAVVLLMEMSLCSVAIVRQVSRATLRLNSSGGGAHALLVMECSQESDFLPWIVSQIAFLVVLAFVAAYATFLSRGVPSTFAESSSVGNALFLLLLAGAILLPVGVLVQTTEAILIVQAGACILVTATFLGTIFAPRLIGAAVLSRKSKVHAREKRQTLPLQPLHFTQGGVTSAPMPADRQNEQQAGAEAEAGARQYVYAVSAGDRPAGGASLPVDMRLSAPGGVLRAGGDPLSVPPLSHSAHSSAYQSAAYDSVGMEPPPTMHALSHSSTQISQSVPPLSGHALPHPPHTLSELRPPLQQHPSSVLDAPRTRSHQSERTTQEHTSLVEAVSTADSLCAAGLSSSSHAASVSDAASLHRQLHSLDVRAVRGLHGVSQLSHASEAVQGATVSQLLL